MRKNTAELWNQLWKGAGAQPATLQTLQTEQRSVRWQRVRKIILRSFGSFAELRVVELGAGMGTYAALFAMEGATVTLVDYSDEALSLARRFFSTLGLSADYVLTDIFHLPKELRQAFDVSISSGVAEHFLHHRRTEMLQKHLEVLNKNGITFIMVPNAANLPYRVYKAIATKCGFWPWGEEYPYHRSELLTFVQTNHLNVYGFFGDSYLWSLNYLNPFALAAKKWKSLKRLVIPQTWGTPLDERWSYSLGLWARKNHS
jgi:2-polyprenyl-3-methyl-5-hydroxy-6-metoxy-1,4-benzoquinol methylase